MAEEEAYFLFIIYQFLAQPQRAEGALIIDEPLISIQRASIKKQLRGYEVAKRIHVDFDPLGKQLCYLVYGVYERVDKEGGIHYKNILKPVAVFESEDEANKFKEEFVKTKGKSYAEKGEILNMTDITPILITDK